MTAWLVMGAHGFYEGRRVNLDEEPCPTVLASGLGSFKYHLEEDGRDMRILVEDANGFSGKGGGHAFVDRTDEPFPCVQASRPVDVVVEHDDMPRVIRRVVHDTSGSWGSGDVTDAPCPTITVGVNSLNSCHFKVESEDVGDAEAARISEAEERRRGDKPPYRVPSMAEVRALPWNGLTAASTFSGCGGSSLGYRMAGFKVAWASEFVDAARATYAANAPDTILDGRDVRQVKPEDVLDALGLRPGELDLFDGSPPCASFSTAGKREAGWGKVKSYSDTSQRTDDLFFEYARLVRGIRPRVFVAENVSGLVKGTAKGYFKMILAELKSCGYRVEARVCDAQWLGVPQTRQRLIFVGVREDLGLAPVFPQPLPYRYSVRDALPWIVGVRHHSDSRIMFSSSDSRPSPSIVASDATSSETAYKSGGGFVEAESTLEGFAIGKEWDKLREGEQSEKYFSLVRPHADAPCPTITAIAGKDGTAGVTHPVERRKFSIAELRRICGFPDDFVLTGSYAQQWERLGRAVPPVMMSHVAAAVRDGVLFKARR